MRDSSLLARVAAALERADRVVLLRPCADAAGSVAVLRERCVAGKGHDWVLDGVDWLQRWLTDGLDERLATHTVIAAGQTPEQTAATVHGLGDRTGTVGRAEGRAATGAPHRAGPVTGDVCDRRWEALP